ncbi:10771_t:CDS:2 [Funneliformis mosseae]|uniref:10771_t:CDS:1 n=1 Tax=Funneliformis mosseae TaxID=27381 RepID=A0A9N9F3J2_FUNMO|nr:10771_t:CDS:2 [Funneliformis mosseae]
MSEDTGTIFLHNQNLLGDKGSQALEEKALKQFVYTLPSIKNPMSLFYVFLQSDAFYLTQILSEESIVDYCLKAKKCNDIVKICKVEILIQAEKESVTSIIIGFKDYISRSVDYTFVDEKVTIKALIDSKSYYSSISKAFAQKIDLYITREFRSEYPAVKEFSIGAINAGKKVIIRGWVNREEVSISLSNIFYELRSLLLIITDTENFVVVDKPEYDLVLGNNWLIWMGDKIDKCDARYWENNEEKRLYYLRNNIDILSPLLYTFYELLFSNFTAINSDREVIITKFIMNLTV